MTRQRVGKVRKKISQKVAAEALRLVEMAYRSHVQKGYELNPGRWCHDVEKIITVYIPERYRDNDGLGKPPTEGK